MDKNGGAQGVKRLLLGVVALLPLGSIFVAAVRDAAMRHPVWSLVIYATYMLVVAVFKIVVSVCGELQKHLIKATTAWLLPKLQARFSLFETRYRSYLRQKHSPSNLKGLEIQGVRSPRLEDVFVDVSLQARPWHELQGQTLTSPELANPMRPTPERTSLGRLLEAGKPSVLALLGSPGSGKTTLLEHTTLRLSSSKKRWGRTGRSPLPVLLALREHVRDFTSTTKGSSPGSGPATLAHIIRRSLLNVALGKEPPDWFEDQLDKGRCVVMLDGLDEVSKAEDRRSVIEWVDRQIARYPNNHWVLTSRPHGYAPLRLSNAQLLEVRRFTPEQITNFINGWYRAIEQLDARAGSESDADAKATDLLNRMRKEPMLYDLGSNPLLLTMIANVHRYRGALPGTRSELYAEICQVLLWKRKEAEGLPTTGPSGADRESVLQEMAYVMMTEKARVVSALRAQQWLQPSLSAVGFTTDASNFLAEISKCGLLVEQEPGVYSFAHQTFQEYLAAAYIANRGSVDVLVRGIEDPWWRETILLWAVRSADPSWVIDACLERGTATTLALAFDCMQEIEDLNPASRQRFHALRARVLNSQQDPRLRGLMTAVEVERRMRRVVWISTNTLVCARPVTRSLYALFRNGDTYAADGTDEAVTLGVSQQDAAGFVEWVNSLAGDSTRYRLPYTTEAADPAMLPVIGSGHGIWTIPDPSTASPAAATQQSAPQLWVSTGVTHPWSTTNTRIRERLARDEARVRRHSHDETSAATAFDRGQQLVGILHAGLIRDLEQLREELQGDGLLPTSPRDTLFALDEELNRIGEKRSAMENCGPVLGLGRRLAHIVDLALTRADWARSGTSSLRQALRNSQRAALLARAVTPGPNFTALTLLGSLGALLHENCRADLGLAAAMVAARAQVLTDRTRLTTTRATLPEETYVVYMTDFHKSLEALAGATEANYQQNPVDNTVNHARVLAAELSNLTTTLCERDSIASQPEITGIVRLAAMTLAAVDERRLGRLAGHSRTVAAAVTILQDRSEGRLPSCEALLLARQ